MPNADLAAEPDAKAIAANLLGEFWRGWSATGEPRGWHAHLTDDEMDAYRADLGRRPAKREPRERPAPERHPTGRDLAAMEGQPR